MDQTFYYTVMDSPVGALTLVATDQSLCGVYFKNNAALRRGAVQEHDGHPVLQRARRQLDEYFAGRRKTFDLPLAGNGTVFQMKAWKELCKIPYGKTISYGDQARGMGDAKKARAVGMANGRNPLSIVVPCHRVVGADGSLTGFGGGLKVKEYLIALEKKFAA